MSRYITGFIQASEYKIIVVWICSELPFSITSISIYYGIHSDIWGKSCYRLKLLRASIFNFKSLDILQDTIGHPSKKLLSLEFATSIRFQLWASRYITRLNRTSEKKVIVARICSELMISNTSLSIRYGIHSDIREKSSCRWILLRASVLN